MNRRSFIKKAITGLSCCSLIGMTKSVKAEPTPTPTPTHEEKLGTCSGLNDVHRYVSHYEKWVSSDGVSYCLYLKYRDYSYLGGYSWPYNKVYSVYTNGMRECIEYYECPTLVK